MGICLYPNTKDASVLERLAGVPEETMRLLHLHQEMVKVYMEFKRLYHLHQEMVKVNMEFKGLSPYNSYDEEGNDVGYDIYCILKGTPIMELENFLMFGWGKFDYSLLPAEMQEESGQLPPGEQAARLLLSASGGFPHWDLQDALQIVNACGGVNWG